MQPTSHHRINFNPSSAEVIVSAQSRRQVLYGFWELTKPRLSFLSMITALVGYMAAQPSRDVWLLVNFISGTALSAGGAAALNQWMERSTDAIMRRTQSRPVPMGVITPGQALTWGIALSAIGFAQLCIWVNALAATISLLTVLSYVLVYTPLKSRTRWATEIGAISGALPPLIGWAAAEGRISTLGWILFAILFFWQIPHFMAIAWLYRRDYASVNFPMLSVIDPDGRRVARWSLIHSYLLVGVSLLPVILGYCTGIYFAVAAISGILFLAAAYKFRRTERRELSARYLFRVSIIYLPALLGVMVIDRWLF